MQQTLGHESTLRLQNVVIYIARFLPVLGVLLGIGLRIELLLERRAIDYDDSMSYLMASGHLSEYASIVAAQKPPFGTWSNASEWRSLLDGDSDLTPKQIAHEAATDVHPPLYFWLLNGWISIVGVHFWSGAALNLLFDLFTVIILGRWAYEIFGREGVALVLATWLLSPIPLLSTPWARQYSLLALWVVALFYLLFKFFDGNKTNHESRNWQWGLAITTTLVIAAGTLTHYYFAFFVFGGLVFVGVKASFVDRSFARFLVPLICTAIAVLLFFALFPEFYSWITTFTRHTPPPPFSLEYRLRRTLITTIVLLFPALLGLACLFFYMILHARRGPQSPYAIDLAQKNDSSANISGSALWIIGLTLLLILFIDAMYILQISPRHSMGPRYVNFIAPLVAFIPAFLFRRGHTLAERSSLISLFMVGMAVTGIFMAATVVREEAHGKYVDTLIQSRGLVLLDNAEVGVWPSLVIHLSDENTLFVADKSFLIENLELWLPELSQSGGLYISVNNPDVPQTITAQLHEVIGKLQMVEHFEVELWNGITVYRFKPEREAQSLSSSLTPYTQTPFYDGGISK